MDGRPLGDDHLGVGLTAAVRVDRHEGEGGYQRREDDELHGATRQRDGVNNAYDDDDDDDDDGSVNIFNRYFYFYIQTDFFRVHLLLHVDEFCIVAHVL